MPFCASLSTSPREAPLALQLLRNALWSREHRHKAGAEERAKQYLEHLVNLTHSDSPSYTRTESRKGAKRPQPAATQGTESAEVDPDESDLWQDTEEASCAIIDTVYKTVV